MSPILRSQLERQAERRDREIGQRSVRLHRQWLAHCLQPRLDPILLVTCPVAAARRPTADQHRLGKDALAHEGFLGIEQRVDALKPEIAHPDRVRVRVAQRDWHAAAPVLADGALLAREAFALNLDVLCSNAAHRVAQSLTDESRAYRFRPRKNGGISRSSSWSNTGSGTSTN
jgi:hypothetical protein